MIHLNSLHTIDKSVWKWLVVKALPECYRAVSIKDFVDDKEEIEYTRSLLPLISGFNGRALIFLPSVRYIRTDDLEAVVRDTSYLEGYTVSLKYLGRYTRKELGERRDFQEAFLMHDQRDITYLLSYEFHGPPTKSRSEYNLVRKLGKIPLHLIEKNNT